MKNQLKVTTLSTLAAIVALSASTAAFAGRCDGNNGNGKGNVCEPVENPYNGQPHEHPKNTNERVTNVEYHTYRNSYHNGVQDKQIGHLRETKVDKTEFYTDQQRQDADAELRAKYIQQNSQGIQHLADHKLDKSEFYTDQKRQDDALAAVNAQADQINTVINNHGDILNNHQQQIDHLSSTMGNQINAAMGRANQAYKEAKLARDEAVGALAVAGHSYDHSEYGLQAAISVASFGGSSALAIGAGGKVSERVFVNGAVTSAGSATGGVLSSTFKF